MALDLHQNFVSAIYLENKLTDIHQILYMHSYWQDLYWDYYTSFFTLLYHSYGPWLTPKFCFRYISWEQIDRISPNFIYAFILTRSMAGLLHILFHIFVPEFWPLIYAKNLFPNKLIEFHQILYMHSYWQDLRWDCYTSFFAHLYQSYGPCSLSSPHLPMEVGWGHFCFWCLSLCWPCLHTCSCLNACTISFVTTHPQPQGTAGTSTFHLAISSPLVCRQQKAWKSACKELWKNLCNLIVWNGENVINFWWPWPSFQGHNFLHSVSVINIEILIKSKQQ